MHKIFTSKEKARRFFKEALEHDWVHLEQCECCGLWSVSRADDDAGAIVGGGDESQYDRICLTCDEED